MTFAQHVHLNVVSSTNDVARELLQDVENIIVSADHQTGGRGRRGRSWQDNRETSVLVSFAMRHHQERSAQDLSADMARGCLAVLSVLQQLGLDDIVRCKYPNDIQAKDGGVWSKLSGVLVEHDFLGVKCQSTIIGIGVNVLQETFPETIGQPATSLRRLGVNQHPKETIECLRLSMERFINTPSPKVFELWKAALGIGLRQTRVNGADGVWMLTDLDENGRLVLANINDGTQRIIDDGDTLRYLD